MISSTKIERFLLPFLLHHSSIKYDNQGKKLFSFEKVLKRPKPFFNVLILKYKYVVIKQNLMISNNDKI